MAGVEFWDSGATNGTTFSEHPWDIAFIGGDPVPGFCKVMDGITEIGIDNKNPDGKDGSAITVKGYRPGPFTVSSTVWTTEQWDFLQALIDKVWRRPNKKSKVAQVAVSVQHPALDLYGINSGALTGITFPADGPFEGSKTVTFKFIENVPPGPKRQTKTNNDPKVVQKLQQDKRAPKNEAPAPPSKNRQNLGPKGPKAAP